MISVAEAISLHSGVVWQSRPCKLRKCISKPSGTGNWYPSRVACIWAVPGNVPGSRVQAKLPGNA